MVSATVKLIDDDTTATTAHLLLLLGRRVGWEAALLRLGEVPGVEVHERGPVHRAQRRVMRTVQVVLESLAFLAVQVNLVGQSFLAFR